jgi:L-alanine-DL-glutamate epimerase-like enolase superfamily enzyme
VSAGARITSVRSGVLRLPMRGSLRWGAGSELNALEHVLVEVRAEGGIRTVSEAPVRPTIYGETAASMRTIVDVVIGPRLSGRELMDPALTAEIDSVPFNHAARGALDTAWRLAQATALGLTPAESFGAERERVRVSFILGIDTLEAMVNEARRVVESGVRVLKVKVGRDPRADLMVLNELRREFAGAGVTLYADANQAYRSSDAPARLLELAKAGVEYVEEPLPVQQLRERSELRAISPLPIIADDSCMTMAELERELDFDTFDILNIKPARTGVTTSLAMMAAAAAAGKGVMIGSQAASGLGTIHCAYLALRPEVDYPCELAFPLKLERDSLERPLTYQDGWLSAAELDGAALAAGVHRDSFDRHGVNMTDDIFASHSEDPQ